MQLATIIYLSYFSFASSCRENEEFEKLSPTQVDKLLDEAKALEASLQEEKEKLLKRLQILSRTLQIVQWSLLPFIDMHGGFSHHF